MNLLFLVVFIALFIIGFIMLYFIIDDLKDYWNLSKIESKLLAIGTLLTILVSITASIVGIVYEIMKAR